MVVTNTQFIPSQLSFGQGFITVIDTKTTNFTNKVSTSAKNPQFITSLGSEVLVVCTGETHVDLATGHHTARGPGALDRFTEDDLFSGTHPSTSIPIPASAMNPIIGGPGSIAVTGDQTAAYIGSGLSATVFKVDLVNNSLVRGTDNPIVIRDTSGNDTMAVHWHPDGFILAASFNSNLIFRLDPVTDELVGNPIDVGLTKDLEGPISIAVRPGESPDVFVLLSVANSVTALDLRQDEPGVHAGIVATGPVNNRIYSFGDSLWIVNSGGNNLQRVHIPGYGSTLPFAIFPVGSAPWDATFVHSDGHSLAYVTLNLHNGVAILDLKTGEIKEIIL
ncbi:MAG: hypothetical protein HUU55_09805 [Myxococcales bacterium]|nr:hypothetical protein [Myxococcales bacterium]